METGTTNKNDNLSIPEHKKGDNTSKKVKTPNTYGKTLYSSCIFKKVNDDFEVRQTSIQYM